MRLIVVLFNYVIIYIIMYRISQLNVGMVEKILKNKEDFNPHWKSQIRKKLKSNPKMENYL